MLNVCTHHDLLYGFVQGLLCLTIFMMNVRHCFVRIVVPLRLIAWFFMTMWRIMSCMDEVLGMCRVRSWSLPAKRQRQLV